MSNVKTLHLQWADGEIEAGTLIEALYEQEQTIAILRQHKNDYMDAAECTRKYLEAENANLRAELERRAVPDDWREVVCMAIDLIQDIRQGTAVERRLRELLAAAPSAPKADESATVQADESLPGEVLGQTCADGGRCHHGCERRCFRRECCTHFSDYTGPWEYSSQNEQEGGKV